MRKLLAVDIQSTFFGDHAAQSLDSPRSFISSVLPNVYIIAGVILFLHLVVGGFLLITAAGNTDQAQNGQKALTSAIIGFIVVFASYWIIQIIETITGIPIMGIT